MRSKKKRLHIMNVAFFMGHRCAPVSTTFMHLQRVHIQFTLNSTDMI